MIKRPMRFETQREPIIPNMEFEHSQSRGNFFFQLCGLLFDFFCGRVPHVAISMQRVTLVRLVPSDLEK